MNPQKVNQDYSLTDSRVDNVGEGLRVLARMIARRLRAKKQTWENNTLAQDCQRAEATRKPTYNRRERLTGNKRRRPPTARGWMPDVLTKAETLMASGMIPVGRPRLLVDFATILRMRDQEKMGWSQIAVRYRQISGQYVSRDTVKRRYLEAKALEATAVN